MTFRSSVVFGFTLVAMLAVNANGQPTRVNIPTDPSLKPVEYRWNVNGLPLRLLIAPKDQTYPVWLWFVSEPQIEGRAVLWTNDHPRPMTLIDQNVRLRAYVCVTNETFAPLYELKSAGATRPRHFSVSLPKPEDERFLMTSPLNFWKLDFDHPEFGHVRLSPRNIPERHELRTFFRYQFVDNFIPFEASTGIRRAISNWSQNKSDLQMFLDANELYVRGEPVPGAEQFGELANRQFLMQIRDRHIGPAELDWVRPLELYRAGTLAVVIGHSTVDPYLRVPTRTATVYVNEKLSLTVEAPTTEGVLIMNDQMIALVHDLLTIDKAVPATQSAIATQPTTVPSTERRMLPTTQPKPFLP